MIQLTSKAIEAVQRLGAERASEGQLLRIFIQSGGCSGREYGMEFAHPGPKDERFEQDGLAFLVDRKSLELMDGSVIDFDDGLTGKGFEIRNPKAESTCGCGKSFA